MSKLMPFLKDGVGEYKLFLFVFNKMPELNSNQKLKLLAALKEKSISDVENSWKDFCRSSVKPSKTKFVQSLRVETPCSSRRTELYRLVCKLAVDSDYTEKGIRIQPEYRHIALLLSPSQKEYTNLDLGNFVKFDIRKYVNFSDSEDAEKMVFNTVQELDAFIRYNAARDTDYIPKINAVLAPDGGTVYGTDNTSEESEEQENTKRLGEAVTKLTGAGKYYEDKTTKITGEIKPARIGKGWKEFYINGSTVRLYKEKVVKFARDNKISVEDAVDRMVRDAYVSQLESSTATIEAQIL